MTAYTEAASTSRATSLPVLAPKEPYQRTAIVDALRGWALLSVVLVNYAIFYSFDAVIRIPPGDVRSRVLKLIVQVFFQAKGWTLLSLLFGYGFSALMANISRSDRSDLRALRLYCRRMFWLSVIAVVNSSFYYGDILKDYVVMGLVISVFYRAPKRTFLILTVCCLIVFPALIPLSRAVHIVTLVPDPPLGLYLSHNIWDVLRFGLLSGTHVLLSFPKYFDWNLVMWTCGFLGAFLQKSGYFERLTHDRRPLRRNLWVSALAAMLLPSLNFGFARLGWHIERYYDAYMWFELSLMVFFSSAVCWAFLKLSRTVVFSSFQYVGRMTLTNYLVQNMVGLLLFSGFGLGLLHRESYSFNIAVAITIYGIQIWFSFWWLSRHRWGPVEWLWRSLTYGKLYSNKQTTLARSNLSIGVKQEF
jgi:uncharacterized protein